MVKNEMKAVFTEDCNANKIMHDMQKEYKSYLLCMDIDELSGEYALLAFMKNKAEWSVETLAGMILDKLLICVAQEVINRYEVRKDLGLLDN